MARKPVIFWFRQDLRLADNRALAVAAETGQPMIAIYILDDKGAGDWPMGGASRWWLHHSLLALLADLESRGVRLVLARGDSREILKALAEEVEADAVYFTRAYEPAQAALENAAAGTLSEIGVEARRFGGNLLFEPESVETKSGGPFKVFTPFYKACLAKTPTLPLETIPDLTPCKDAPRGERLEDWELTPIHPDWAGGLRETWIPGEAGAHKRLDEFLENRLTAYPDSRDRPGEAGTSRLS
ncbi:MAG TPA: deoxyribodipyrimidine photo-lyase, partial [Alphaproteobacteria bacterium]|nr:deoxyribodipyrimidine photo-lyase [Alphaproteobacteria bacterium]